MPLGPTSLEDSASSPVVDDLPPAIESDEERSLEEALEESFPASDPPAANRFD